MLTAPTSIVQVFCTCFSKIRTWQLPF